LYINQRTPKQAGTICSIRKTKLKKEAHDLSTVMHYQDILMCTYTYPTYFTISGGVLEGGEGRAERAMPPPLLLGKD